MAWAGQDVLVRKIEARRRLLFLTSGDTHAHVDLDALCLEDARSLPLLAAASSLGAPPPASKSPGLVPQSSAPTAAGIRRESASAMYGAGRGGGGGGAWLFASKQICKEKKKTQPHTQRTRARLLSLAHEVIAAAAAHAGCFRRPPAQSGTLQAAHVGARHGSSPSTTVVAVKGFFKEMSRTPWTCSSSSGGSQIHRCKDRENWASHYFFQNWVLVLSKLN
ncbi:uncharacterized protein [Triticum aestivum]|uniref:uncharacterized protein n=1 Tax=Triticum aestivum TaxID=4565 RepID=UPI001D01CF2D|nr:uncharacterized protein LOC123171453 [Triticum aestivum]